MQHVYVRYLATALATALCAVALLPGYIQLFPMNFLPEYPIWREQFEFAARPSASEPEVLILGDSRAHAALVPEIVAPGSRSLAVAGATSIETYALLRRYLGVHRPPRDALLSFAPFHLEHADAFWERAVKSKSLSPGETFEVFERSLALGDPVLGHASRARLYGSWALHWLNFPPYYLPELENARGFLRRSSNLRKQGELRAGAGHLFYGRLESCSELNAEARRSRFEPSPLLDAYLRDLLALAAAHGIRVTYAAMPMNRSSWEQLSDAFREGYRAHLEALRADHPEARIATELEFLPDDHFGDRSHVNPRGARVVSERYAALLRGS